MGSHPISARKISWQLMPSAAPIRPFLFVPTQQGDRNIATHDLTACRDALQVFFASLRKPVYGLLPFCKHFTSVGYRYDCIRISGLSMGLSPGHNGLFARLLLIARSCFQAQGFSQVLQTPVRPVTIREVASQSVWIAPLFHPISGMKAVFHSQAGSPYQRLILCRLVISIFCQ